MPALAIPRFRPSLAPSEAMAFLGGLVPIRAGLQAEFETGFGRDHLDGSRVVLAPSGRLALLWLLEAVGLERGDEVITQAFNFPAVPAAIQAAGCRPRFLDVHPGSFEGDWSRLEASLTPRTRAVLVTHLFGNPAPVKTIAEICASRGVTVIEDCAQGVGATCDGHPLGTFGSGALFSLGTTKNLTLLGGGAAASSDTGVARRLAALAGRHPRTGAAASLMAGAKAAIMAAATHPLVFSAATLPLVRVFERRGVDLVHRITEERSGPLTAVTEAPLPSRPMAALGLAQLRRLEARNRARVRSGWYLRSKLEADDELVIPPMRVGSVFMSFPVFHPRRHALARELRRRGVDTDVGFMADCAGMDLFGDSGADCPQSVRAAREILHLPVHPFLRRRHLDRIANAVRAARRTI